MYLGFSLYNTPIKGKRFFLTKYISTYKQPSDASFSSLSSPDFFNACFHFSVFSCSVSGLAFSGFSSSFFVLSLPLLSFSVFFLVLALAFPLAFPLAFGLAFALALGLLVFSGLSFSSSGCSSFSLFSWSFSSSACASLFGEVGSGSGGSSATAGLFHHGFEKISLR